MMKNVLTIALVFSLLNWPHAARAEEFKLNPDTLRQRLVSENISLSRALNLVQASKLEVNAARAKLLPTLNLTALLPALANPTFLIASVAFMFPFLIPTKWAALKQKKELFEADKESFKALQLNVYSSALALYYTYILDRKVQLIHQQEAAILESLYRQLQRQSDVLGNVSPQELYMARAQWQEALIKVSKLAELLLQEKSTLRKMLDLPLESQLQVEEVTLPPTDSEGLTSQEVADASLKLAPESAQLNHLLRAAKAGRFAKVLGFLDSASLSGRAGDGQSAFGNLELGTGFNFGADVVVNIKVSSNTIESIKLRQEEQRQEHEGSAEVSLGRLQMLKDQQQLGDRALADRRAVFQAMGRQYEMGLLPLQNLLQVQAQLTDAVISREKSDWQLTLQRLSLQRQLLEGPFQHIKGCQAKEVKPPRGFLGIRWRKAVSLDVLCRQQ